MINVIYSSYVLGVIHKCQHFHECTNSTLFLDPPPPSPPSVQTNILGFQNMGFTQHNISCETTKIYLSFKPVWYVTNDLQISVNYVYIPNLIWRYLLWEHKKCVQFHNITFKMPESQLLIGLETSFKSWQKA